MKQKTIKQIAQRSQIRVASHDDRERIIRNFIKVVKPYYSERRGLMGYNYLTEKCDKEFDVGIVKLPFGEPIKRSFQKDYSWHPKTKEERIYSFYTDVRQKMYYRIRLYGEEIAINMLVEIYGERYAIDILRDFAIKNDKVLKLSDLYMFSYPTQI